MVYGAAASATPKASTCAGSNTGGDGVLTISGVVPSLAVTADTAPAVPPGLPKRSESGVGALMPWADKLYMVSYLSVPNYGAGTGLYAIDSELRIEKLANHSSVYANRMIHHWTDSIVMGPYVIDAAGRVRTITALLEVRIGAVAEHINHPEDMIYMISMDGPFYEVNLTSLAATLLFSLVDKLKIPISPNPHTTGQCYPHFKDSLTVHTSTDGKGGVGPTPGGRVYVASNGYNEADYTEGSYCGRLASWDGDPKSNWTILESTAFYGLAARKNYGRMVYASGWDRKSVILKVKDQGSPDAPSSNTDWRTYRLPKASHAFDHGWQTEWPVALLAHPGWFSNNAPPLTPASSLLDARPRIREVETERYLLDAHGMLYELSPLGWTGSSWGVRPISQHLRVIPDFSSFRGMLVMGGNEVSSIFDNNVVTGQSQSGLWLGKTDDLWSWGKPQGWGSVWREERVQLGDVSDPYLMTGFDKKVLHLSCESCANSTDHQDKIEVAVELDTLGNAVQTGRWRTLDSVVLQTPSWYFGYVIPDGMSAHWVRLRLITGLKSYDGLPECPNCTATFIYS